MPSKKLAALSTQSIPPIIDVSVVEGGGKWGGEVSGEVRGGKVEGQKWGAVKWSGESEGKVEGWKWG